MIDGGDVSSTGFLAAGSNGTSGTTLVASASKTYTDWITAADTIDVTLTAASADVTEGVLRVYAVIAELDAEPATAVPVAAPRDQLA